MRFTLPLMSGSFLLMVLLVLMPLSLTAADVTKVHEIGSRRELFVDAWLVERLSGGAERRLQVPQARNIVLRTDRPWEGNACHYRTVFRDGEIVRMYYQTGDYQMRGTPEEPRYERPHEPFFCYAESRDGITFARPELGLYEFAGSRNNNILFAGNAFEKEGIRIVEAGVSVFRDSNPACRPLERYKAIATAQPVNGPRRSMLVLLTSPDGIAWSLASPEPVIRDGRFDSQNLAFFDRVHGEYRAYHRGIHRGLRIIQTETSVDALKWTPAEELDFGHSPPMAMYTNQILPYYRAPHILVGFPLRYIERAPGMAASLPQPEQRQLRAAVAPRYGSAVTDAMFMSSRDGRRFDRWNEAFLRPTGASGNWTYGDNSIAWGIVETEPHMEHCHREMSLYATEGYWVGESLNVRRYSLRLDGFVSVHAPLAGGELLTRPLRFDGNQLTVNVATSAGGSLRVELQNIDGTPIPGFEMESCIEIYGDYIEQVVQWEQGSRLSSLSGKPIRIRFALRDADLYAIQFIANDARVKSDIGSATKGKP